MTPYPFAIRLLLLSGLTFSCAVSAAENMAEEDPTPADIDWQAPLTVATGDGHVGPWHMNDSEFHYVDDASVALDNQGQAIMVWVDNRRQDVFSQRYAADNEPQLLESANVSRSPDIFSWLPRVAVADENQVYVAWQEIVFSGGSHGGEIFFARSNDGGVSFSEPVNLSQTTNGAGKGRLTEERWDNGSLDLALGPDGEIVIAWTEYQGPLRLRRSTDGGRSFTDALQVAGTEQRPARGPSLAFGTDRDLYLAWTEGEDASADIQVARSTNAGQNFNPPVSPVPSDAHSDFPKLAMGRQGHLHLVYTEARDRLSKPAQLAYVRLNERGQATEDARFLDHGIAGKDQAAAAPSLALDEQGHIYILWEQYPQPDNRARGLGLSVSRDGGDTFSAPLTVPGSRNVDGAINGSLQGKLARKLSVRDGYIAISNSHFWPGQKSQILLLRGQLPQD